MSLKHGILGLLNYSPMSGYDLMKAFNQSLKHFWSAQTSQIYRELETMSHSGWIEAKEESQRGHLVRTVFAIAAAGREELERWLKESVEERSAVKNPFLLRLFFSSISGPESIRGLVESKKTRAEASAAELRRVLAEVIPARLGQAKDELAAFCWTQAAEYGLSQFEAEAAWADACLSKIGAMRGGKP
jgi:PadR family transcriptional regulator, regulatory protein AphA